MEDASMFKILSTLAIFLFGTVWAFRNLRAIFDKVTETTGIGKTSEERQVERQTITTESGTKIIITSNTESNTSG